MLKTTGDKARCSGQVDKAPGAVQRLRFIFSMLGYIAVKKCLFRASDYSARSNAKLEQFVDLLLWEPRDPPGIRVAGLVLSVLCPQRICRSN